MSKTRVKQPSFRKLTGAECRALLARHHVGRIAFAQHERVDIEPIHYVFSRGQVVVRTSPGTKLTALQHAPWVAFEVDEVEGPFDWRSVVAHGTAYVVEPTGEPNVVAAYKSAIRQLRSIEPKAFRAHDPVPFRDVVLRIYLDEITGREASSTGAAPRGMAK